MKSKALLLSIVLLGGVFGCHDRLPSDQFMYNILERNQESLLSLVPICTRNEWLVSLTFDGNNIEVQSLGSRLVGPIDQSDYATFRDVIGGVGFHSLSCHRSALPPTFDYSRVNAISVDYISRRYGIPGRVKQLMLNLNFSPKDIAMRETSGSVRRTPMRDWYIREY